MDIYLHNIWDGFRKQGIDVGVWAPGNYCVRRVEKHKQKEPMEEGVLYVGGGNDDGGMETILVCAAGKLEVQNGDGEYVFNTVLGIMQYYEDWERQLISAALEQDSLQEMADLGERMFDCSVLLLDENNAPMIRSRNAADIQEIYRYLSRHGEDIIPIDAEFGYAGEPERRRAPGEILAFMGDIWYKEEIIGKVFLYDCGHMIQNGRMYLLKSFMYILESFILLNPEKYSNTSRAERFLKQAVSGTLSEWFRLEREAERLHFEKGDCLSVFVVDFQSDSGKTGLYHNTLRGMGYTLIAVKQDQYIALLVDRTREPYMERIVLNLARSLECRISAGESGLFMDMSSVRDYYRQAQTVLEYAKRAGREYLNFSEIVCQEAERCLEGNPLLETLEHPDIGKLRDYDREHGTAYLDTLNMLLFFGGNRAHILETLGIHGNTLRYRVQKIRELLSGDPEDPVYRRLLM